MMKTTIRKSNIARIEVQRNFCQHCGLRIRQELQKIEDINNVVFYPESAMVVFSFYRANELATALNVLSDLGYPEVGEVPKIYNGNSNIHCACTPMKYNA